jgi:hypothetical protein
MKWPAGDYRAWFITHKQKNIGKLKKVKRELKECNIDSEFVEFDLATGIPTKDPPVLHTDEEVANMSAEDRKAYEAEQEMWGNPKQELTDEDLRELNNIRNSQKTILEKRETLKALARDIKRIVRKHVYLIRKAKALNLDFVAIFEDTVHFCNKPGDDGKRITAKEAFASKPDPPEDWMFLYLGGMPVKIKYPTDGSVLWKPVLVYSCQAYLVRREMFDYIIENAPRSKMTMDLFYSCYMHQEHPTYMAYPQITTVKATDYTVEGNTAMYKDDLITQDLNIPDIRIDKMEEDEVFEEVDEVELQDTLLKKWETFSNQIQALVKFQISQLEMDPEDPYELLPVKVQEDSYFDEAEAKPRIKSPVPGPKTPPLPVEDVGERVEPIFKVTNEDVTKATFEVGVLVQNIHCVIGHRICKIREGTVEEEVVMEILVDLAENLGIAQDSLPKFVFGFRLQFSVFQEAMKRDAIIKREYQEFHLPPEVDMEGVDLLPKNQLRDLLKGRLEEHYKGELQEYEVQIRENWRDMFPDRVPHIKIARSPTDSTLPFVSVVTPTRNLQHLFPIVMNSWFNQTYPYDKMEWVILDQGDSDNHVRGLLPEHTEDPRIRVISYPHRTRMGRLRNILADAAKGEYILHMDTDCHYAQCSVLNRVSALLQDGKECVGTTEIAAYDLLYEKADYMCYRNTYEVSQYFFEGSMGYTKKFWKEREFDPDDKFQEGRAFIEDRWDRCLDLPCNYNYLEFIHLDNLSGKKEFREDIGFRVEVPTESPFSTMVSPEILQFINTFAEEVKKRKRALDVG